MRGGEARRLHRRIQPAPRSSCDGRLSGIVGIRRLWGDEKRGVEIIAGPGPRRGARIGRPAISLYARDPDENLLEWMVYL